MYSMAWFVLCRISECCSTPTCEPFTEVTCKETSTTLKSQPSRILMKTLGNLLQFCINCLSPELGASVLIFFRTLAAWCMQKLLCCFNHLGTNLVAWKASEWVFMSRTKQNIEQFSKFYQYSEWTQLMLLATTDVSVLGSLSNKNISWNNHWLNRFFSLQY